MKDKEYYFHQTPTKLAEDLMVFIPTEAGDTLLEPFKGEGAFYNIFPNYTNNIYCEIEEGIDYKEKTENIDWVITNPPFKLPDKNGKIKNAIFPLLLHFSLIAKKGIAFLVNDYGLNTLTTKRLQQIEENGFYLKKLIVCGVKKWRGRYYLMIFTKEPCDFLSGLLNIY